MEAFAIKTTLDVTKPSVRYVRKICIGNLNNNLINDILVTSDC
jgi:hypothetical protein